jgi:predicted ABC-type ATPase
VPEADVRRRFLPSLRNFFNLYLPLADEALLFDGVSRSPQLVARWTRRQAVIEKPEIYEAIQKQAATAKASQV